MHQLRGAGGAPALGRRAIAGLQIGQERQQVGTAIGQLVGGQFLARFTALRQQKVKWVVIATRLGYNNARSAENHFRALRRRFTSENK